MFIISQQQAGQRWNVITPPLREALFSDVNADFVWNLCQSEHLTEEKSYQVAEISGDVLLGFLHPDDLAGELVSSIDLPAPLAKTISEQINSRVFAPLRADIDKVYSPLSKSGNAPIASKASLSTPNSASNVMQANIATPVSKPTTPSDIGWSKQPAAAFGTPAGATNNTTLTTAQAMPVPHPPAEPAPVMLHEDTTFKPAEKNAGFTLSRPGSNAEMNMNRNVLQTPPPRPAVLEFGRSTMPSQTAQAAPKSSAPAPAVPRYSEFRPSLSSAPTASAGPRSVNQIAPAAPVAAPTSTPAPTMPSSVPVPHPPAASSSMPVPRPPQATQTQQPPRPPQNNKPIVKDFL